MKAVLELELIGDDAARLMPPSWRPWVARLVANDDGLGFRRIFLRAAQKDYARANSIGSRGVYAYYVLGDGVYDVHRRTSWQNTRRYYLRVANGRMTEITRQEVYKCLNAS